MYQGNRNVGKIKGNSKNAGRRHTIRRYAVCLLSGLTLLFYGAMFTADNISTENQLRMTSGRIRTQSNDISISNKVWEKEYYNTNKELCLTLAYRYPVLSEGNRSSIGRINEQIIAQRETWIKDQQELIDTANKDDIICSTSGNEVNYGVTYNEDDIISILFEGYLFTGGAHGMPYRMPQTFRVSTGEQVTLTEITGLSKEQVRARVLKQFRLLYEANPEGYWENAVALVGNLAYEDYSYYVEQDGIHVYFNPYFVAPYAAGFVEIIL